MMLQEEVKFDCTSAAIQSSQGTCGLCRTSRDILIICGINEWQAPKDILERVEKDVLTLNQFLLTRLEHGQLLISETRAGRDDFALPPDAEAANVGQANFEWVVEAVSEW